MSLQTVLRNQKLSFNLSTFHQFVYNSKLKGAAAAYQYINGADYSTFFLGKSGNQNITLPQLPAYPANCVSINGKKMADIKMSAFHVPQHKETENFWNEIPQWPNVDGGQRIADHTVTRQL
jgi:hypothetical protein